jgi:hypothetical protein
MGAIAETGRGGAGSLGGGGLRQRQSGLVYDQFVAQDDLWGGGAGFAARGGEGEACGGDGVGLVPRRAVGWGGGGGGGDVGRLPIVFEAEESLEHAREADTTLDYMVYRLKRLVSLIENRPSLAQVLLMYCYCVANVLLMYCYCVANVLLMCC